MSSTAHQQQSRRARVVVLISGNGSNLQALLDAATTSGGKLAHADLALVVSNRSTAFGLTRAARAGVPTLTFPLKPFRDAGKSREAYDEALAQAILAHPALHGAKPDLVVLAGWMHILSPAWLAHFAGRVINLHPALPGEFDGAHAIERAYKASREEGGITRTGCMVHHVIPEVDKGEVIIAREVPIHKDDTLEALEERIHAQEHVLIVDGAVEFLKQHGFGAQA
ncbi:Bifunctional purine biosynthetic protein ADE5,7 [Blastocladiella emersonii ATCC 22665]|nr:Bifunctional purine biosynthetic protein ADE5,7 [Blastocladiella emersonii ATCC 22665]